MQKKGFLAIWNSIAPDEEAQRIFLDWHSQWHLPERAAVEGMTQARRYSTIVAGWPDYFTLYDAATANVFRDGPYLSRPKTPSPDGVHQSFRGFQRGVYSVIREHGTAIGGAIACVNSDHEPSAEQVGRVAEMRGVVAVRVGRANPEITDVQSARINPPPLHPPGDFLWLIEATRPDFARAAANSATSAGDPTVSVFVLEQAIKD
jgi:hypothetical protein